MKNSAFLKQTKARLLCVLVCVLLVTGMPTILLGQVSHHTDFYRSDLSFTTVIAEDGNTYEKVSLGDIPQIDELGKPCLPVKYVKLIVSSHQDVEEIVLKHVEKQIIPGTHFILPAQSGIPTSIDYRKPEFVRPDSSVYESDAPYPSEIVKVVHDGYFDGSNHIITLAVYPLQYYPKSGRLVFFSSVDFTLKMKSAETKAIHARSRSAKNQKIYDSILKKIVDNPQDIFMYQIRPPLRKAGAIQSGPVPFYGYVIITSNALKPAFAAFVSWKRRKGLDIGVVTTEEIFANYTGDFISGIFDDAGSVRQYLSEAYQSGTVWALLAGDHTIVPVRYGAGFINCSWEDYSYDKIPADLYFADFNGDWNVDIETPIRYGEENIGTSYDDDPDYNPEIFVGRLPCTNEQEIAKWIEKLFEYELNPGNGDYSYLKKSFWVSADQMIDQPDLVSPHYPSSFTHTMMKGDNPGPDVVEEMSNKYGILNWYCHGGVNMFSTNRSNFSSRFVWTTDDGKFYDANDELKQSGVSGDGLDNMTNNDYPSVVYSICCETCAFDDFRSTDNPSSIPGNCYPTDQRSMVEGFNCMNWDINGPLKLGYTRNGYVSYSWQLHREFSDLWRTGFVDSESGESSFHGGVAEAVSKQNYVGGLAHYLRYSHNLFGCPETEIWTDTPSTFTNVTITDNGSSITVNAGVSGTEICACSGDNGTDYHFLAHNVSSYTFTTTVRPLYITITKHNYIPYTAVTGGTFTSNEIWFGNLHVLGSVVIENDNTLTIQPGTTVKFAPDTWLSVYGTLEAVGTPSDRITFTRSGSSNWEGISLQSNTNDSKNLVRRYRSRIPRAPHRLLYCQHPPHENPPL